MAAIGSSWAAGTSWADDVWAVGTWAAAGAGVPAGGLDLTTLFVRHLDALSVTTPTDDLNTLLTRDVVTVRALETSPDDLNTAYATQLS